MRDLSFAYMKCFLVIASAFMVFGCASSDMVLKPVYQPVGEAKGPGGTIVMVVSVPGPSRPGAESLSSVYGDVKDGNGKIKGNIISSVSPEVFIKDALTDELQKAGYKLNVENSLPKGVRHAIVINKAQISLDETTSLVKMEGSCRVSLAIDLWREGAMVRKLSYEKAFSDYAVKDREKLHNQLLQKTLSAVMKDAQADIVNYMTKK